MLGVLNLEPRAFIVSFTCYYVALHLVEAVLLKRQFAGASPALVRGDRRGRGASGALRDRPGTSACPPQPSYMMQPHEVQHAATETAREGFNAGETIIGHVANSSADHPLIHIHPKIYGIDLSGDQARPHGLARGRRRTFAVVTLARAAAT